MPPSASSLFFNDPATTEIYTPSLHDALPISRSARVRAVLLRRRRPVARQRAGTRACDPDRGGSTRARQFLGGRHARSEKHSLNSPYPILSYSVLFLKQKRFAQR